MISFPGQTVSLISVALWNLAPLGEQVLYNKEGSVNVAFSYTGTFETKRELGLVMHTCNLNTLGDQGRTITSSGPAWAT